jgi:hypothetical protein
MKTIHTLKFTALLLIALGLTSLCSSCKKEDSKVYKVTYSIGCTDCMVVYVSNTEGLQKTEYHQNSSWTYSFNGKPGQQLLLLAYNTSPAPQGVNAKIAINDVVTKDRTTYCPINGSSFCVDTIQ